tara:strand:- start:767 stop:1093 length:327 start_codon:yes stop_codon:yes gene_type:complete
VHEDNIYGKPTVFIAMGSQSPNIKDHMEQCQKMLNADVNLVAIPFDNNGTEPGDDYEIVAHYENVLGIKFYVTEKIDNSHKFFKDFGIPTSDYTEYHFDDKTKFVKKV